MTEIVQKMIDLYGIAGLIAVYLLFKDYQSQNILKKITDSYIKKVEDLKSTMEVVRKIGERLLEMEETQINKLKHLEKENELLRKEIRDLKNRSVM